MPALPEAGSFTLPKPVRLSSEAGLAIIPFLHGGVVNQLHWLTEPPGPVVITGLHWLLGRRLFGGLSAALGIFLPCYLFVILPAPYFKRIARNPWIAAFVEGVQAPATRAIAGAAVVLGRRAILDSPTAALGRSGRVPARIIILISGILGFLLRQP